MKNEIIYRQANQKELVNCLKLASKFRKNINLNRKSIEWEYFLNPFGKAKIFVAEYKNKFIGMTVCIPLKFQNNKKTYNGFRVQDAITDINFIRREIKSGIKIPRKDGMGIFPNLIKINNDFLDKNSEINIGFANEKALPFWERNNWIGLCEIPLILKTIDKNQEFQCEYNSIKKFTNIHEDIWRENINDKLDIIWTKEYSNWRYVLNPKSNYKIFEIKNNLRVIGYMVLKKYELEDKTKVGHICQIVCHDNYIKDSVNFANNYFFNLSTKKLTMWRINDESLFFNDLGFKKIILKNKKFIYKGKKPCNKSSWNLSMSYSDIY